MKHHLRAKQGAFTACGLPTAYLPEHVIHGHPSKFHMVHCEECKLALAERPDGVKGGRHHADTIGGEW